MKQWCRLASVVGIAVGVSGCASIVEGRSQQIAVNTVPPAAQCDFNRDGAAVAQLQHAPGSVLVRKTRSDITIECKKPGYQNATYINKSGLEGWFWGNVIAGGVIGMAVDWSTGAYNKYDDMVNITLLPGESRMAAPQATLAPYDDGNAPVLLHAEPSPFQQQVAPALTAPAARIPSTHSLGVVRQQHDYPLPPPTAANEDRYVPEPLPPIAVPSAGSANQSGWGVRSSNQ